MQTQCHAPIDPKHFYIEQTLAGKIRVKMQRMISCQSCTLQKSSNFLKFFVLYLMLCFNVGLGVDGRFDQSKVDQGRLVQIHSHCIKVVTEDTKEGKNIVTNNTNLEVITCNLGKHKENRFTPQKFVCVSILCLYSPALCFKVRIATCCVHSEASCVVKISLNKS